MALPTRNYKDTGWTLDQFLQAAQRLTRVETEGRTQFGASVDDHILQWFPFLWANGGDVFDSPDNPRKFAFVSRETEQTLQWLVDLKFRYRVAPQPTDLQGTRGNLRYRQGQVAMRVDLCSEMSASDRIEGLRWDVVPLPRGPKGRFARLAGTGLGIHPQSRNKETAWAFVKWYSGAESPRAVGERPTTLHPLKSARASKAFMAWAPPEAKQVWFETLEYGRYQAQHPKWQELMEGDGARKHYEAALRQEVSVKNALEAIRRHADAVVGVS